MKTIIINGNDFSDLGSFYDEIERKFTNNLDWKVGRSINAVDDILQGGFGVADEEEPIKIVWENSKKSKLDLGYSAQASSYKVSIWHKTKINKHNPTAYSQMKEKYKKAKNNEGPTLFDDIVKVIHGHKHIELELK